MELTWIEDLIRQYAHLTDEEIEGYVVGSLDAHSSGMVEKHLRSCIHCRREVEILKESLQDTDVFDDPNMSEDLVRQEVIRILDRIRPSYKQMWIADRSFPLEPSKEHPGLLRINGQLVLAGFEDAIDKDREAPGNCTLRIEGIGLNPIVVPMRDFKDVSDTDFEELKLAAKTEQAESQATSDQPIELQPVFICHLHDKRLEVLSDESSTTLFLRLT
jgi:hypothetical protein